jgi:RES domain-containing protein
MDRPGPNAVIAARLAEFEVGPWSGDTWRHTFADNPPERRNVRGARWNPPDIEALYVSLDRATAIAEGNYLIAAQPLQPRATRTVHRLHISLGSVVDLTDRAKLSSLGVDDDALASDDLTACQAVGAAAAFLHLDGIIVPSARSPGHNIVILFANPDSVPDIQILESPPL